MQAQFFPRFLLIQLVLDGVIRPVHNTGNSPPLIKLSVEVAALVAILEHCIKKESKWQVNGNEESVLLTSSKMSRQGCELRGVNGTNGIRGRGRRRRSGTVGGVLLMLATGS